MMNAERDATLFIIKKNAANSNIHTAGIRFLCFST